jgi:protoheme IX farnesyltransferase
LSAIESLASFIILIKPGIVAAVLLAGFAGMVLAARGLPDIQTCLICLASLFLAASGSALINGVLDARMDLRMERLKARVAAMGKAGQGRVLTTALTGICLALFLACRFLGPLAFLLILVAVLTYTLLYTLCLKRYSPWGTVTGGVPGALPVLIGYAATAHSLGLDSIILFTVMLLWQPPHFWSLALEHRRDYLSADVPVLSVTHGERYAGLLILLYASALLPASLSLWLFGFCSTWYAVCALLSGVAYLGACYHYIFRSRRFSMAFTASILYLIFLFTAIVGDICFIQRGMQ